MVQSVDEASLDLEKEKLLLLGLYLKERATFRLCKIFEEEEPSQILKDFPYSEKEIFKIAKEEIKKCERLKIRIIYYKEEEYPEILKNIPYKPPFLYVLGELSFNSTLAIVGTRKPTPYGKEIVEKFVPELVEAGLTTVSGLARGIDTLVHKTTLKEGGKTVAVLGTGLDIIYPPENRELFLKILDSGSAIVSEFPLGTRPKRENFPRRNRVISGLSQGVLVVEAGRRSGTLITAKWAQDQGRDVFVCPGNIFSEQSQGTHYLLKNGAIPVTSTEDILYHLGIEYKPLEKGKEEATSLEVSQEERRILECLSQYPTHLENLLAQTGFDLPQLLSLLTELELKGLVKSLPGKFYQRCS
jgi:DNA processing protein